MGIDDFITEKQDRHKVYKTHDKDEKLEQLIEEYQERFPVELRIDFVEVSPRMERCNAKAYKRAGKKYYIRVSEEYLERATEEELRRTVLHEMVHIYLYQRGYSKHGHGKYFRWVLGRVGGSMTNSTIHSTKWEKCIEPFIEEDEI
jgi:predicted SprT family Zn-dependent metalloprotease